MANGLTDSHAPTLRNAAFWSALWISVALAFGLVLLAIRGPAVAGTYYTAYLLEKSLSIDNLFVFALIFGELGIRAEHQRRVLAWGVVGALVMRAVLIVGGIVLLDRFHWVIYPFAALILFAAVRLLFGEKKERQVVIAACAACGSWIARFIPVTPLIRGGSFWIRQNGKLVATPLFIALIVVETSDIVFAMDSVPAVLAITRDPLLVYTSNVFAMLGLRSLYFLLAGAIERFHALRYALGVVLALVGVKMLLTNVIEIPNWVSLAAIIGVIGITLLVSARTHRAMVTRT